MIKFEKVTLDKKELINEYLYKYGENSCQHSFTAMIALNEKYDDQVSVTDECLYILRNNLEEEEYRVYLFPLTKNEFIKDAVNNILEDAHEHGKKAAFISLTENAKEIIETNFSDKFMITEDRDLAEYVYSKDLMVNLTGRKLSSKRNRIRAFWSEFTDRVRIEKITKDNLDEVRKFQREWFNSYDGDDIKSIEIENKAIGICFENYQKLSLKGIAIYIDNEIKAYAFGCKLSDECIDELIEKADRNYTGLYQVVCNEFAKRCAKDFKYINREEDLGKEGLRTAKLRYQPEFLINKYIVIEK